MQSWQLGSIGWHSLGPTYGRCRNWVGISGRPPYVIPPGSAGWNKKNDINLYLNCIQVRGSRYRTSLLHYFLSFNEYLIDFLCQLFSPRKTKYVVEWEKNRKKKEGKLVKIGKKKQIAFLSFCLSLQMFLLKMKEIRYFCIFYVQSDINFHF